MKTIILTDKHFDAQGVFTGEEFFNPNTGRYEFNGNVEVRVAYSWFTKSIFVEGDQTVEGYQYVKGYKLLKPRRSITINHIGSRNAATTFYFTVDAGVMVRCGCKFLPIDEFEQKVKSTHGDNQFAHEYQCAIEYAKKMDAYYRGLRGDIPDMRNRVRAKRVAARAGSGGY